MTHKPIQFINVSLTFPHKVCFEDFTMSIQYGSRIAIIGYNGSGKSTLLQIVQSNVQPSEGKIIVPKDVHIGYVPQVITAYEALSGGQRLNAALTEALSLDPNVLLLDEPTNHLDLGNRKSLMRMLRTYPGTLIIVTHDVELLRSCVDTLWHIDNGKIQAFTGQYDDYIQKINSERKSIEQELSRLNHAKKDTHHSLMKEQARAKSSGLRGEKSIQQRKWPTVVSGTKARRAEETSGRKKNNISNKKQDLIEKLSELRLPEIIKPKFSLSSAEIGGKALVSVNEGSISYEQPILTKLNLSLAGGERIAITGDNGSGKSTLIKAILGVHNIIREGSWRVPKVEDIGYLDQHYYTLTPHKTVLETIHDLVPIWPHTEVRRHLNDFLFRKNEEVNTLVSNLSGGEKVRLSLARIAAKTPKLLILDEVTNNLDLPTREHVIQVLKIYPGAMIVISHDEDFLRDIGVERFYSIIEGRLFEM